MAIAGRREWCRYRADILDIVEGAGTSTMNSSPASTVIVGGVRVLTEKRVFGPICAHVLLPCASQTPGAIPAQGLGTVRSR
jgi:hypothetical protein